MNPWLTVKRQFLRHWLPWSVLIVLLVICCWPIPRYTVTDIAKIANTESLDRASNGDYTKRYLLTQSARDPNVQYHLHIYRMRWTEEADRRLRKQFHINSTSLELDGIGDEAYLNQRDARVAFRRKNLVVTIRGVAEQEDVDLGAEIREVAKQIDNQIRRGQGVSWSIDIYANKVWLQEGKDRVEDLDLGL